MIVNSTQTLFWICSFGLTLMLASVVIFPLLRQTNMRSKSYVNLVHLNVSIFKERLEELEADHRNKIIENDEYLERKIDLERQLLAANDSTDRADVVSAQVKSSQNSQFVSRWLVLMLFLIIPLLSFSAYYFLSKPQHIALINFWKNQDQFFEVADAMMAGNLVRPSKIASSHPFELLQAMQVNAYQHPFDAKRWVNLSEAYVDGDAIGPALAALEHAYRLKPENNDIAMTYAQMRFFSLQGMMDPVTQGILARILAQDPEHEGALLLMSMATYHDQHYRDAIYWLRRLKHARLARATLSQPVNPAIIAQLDQTIHDAEVANGKLAQDASAYTVIVDLKVADLIKSKLHDQDNVFVYVRALQGSTLPYAVQKIPVASLLNAMKHNHEALTVTLSDVNSMLPTRTISSARLAGTPLVVAARISQYHDPIGHRGDLESLPVPINFNAVHGEHYVVHIDQIRS